MATTFSWNIANLERETADGYVYTAHYTINADDETYTASSYGSIGLERPEGSMIPFDQLTKEIVVGWVKDRLGAEQVEGIEAALQAKIDQQHTPTQATGLPW